MFPLKSCHYLHRIVQHLSNHGLSIPNPIGSSKYITGPKTIYTERVDLDVLKPSKLDCRGRVIGTWSQVGVCLATLSKRESHLVQRGPLWGRGRENSMYFSASWVIYLAIYIHLIFKDLFPLFSKGQNWDLWQLHCVHPPREQVSDGAGIWTQDLCTLTSKPYP